MNRIKLVKATLLSLLLVPLLFVVPPVLADGSHNSGTFTATVTTESVAYSSGGYTLYYFTGTEVFTGAISGTPTFTVYILVSPSGTDVSDGTVTCAACTVGGHTGALYTEFTGQGTFGGSGSGSGTWAGSGGLAGFHDSYRFQFTTTATGFTGPYQLYQSHDE